MFINLSGTQLYYEKQGSGRPLVLVHGNGEDHTIFNEAIDFLKQYYTCYAIDSRGHGESAPCEVLHYEDMAGDIVEFLEKLDLSDVIYYGFSDGGIVGVLAASSTERISTMVISGTNISPEGVKKPLRMVFRLLYPLSKDDKIRLMMEEPHIDRTVMHRIKAKTLVLAGSKDLVEQKETLLIGANIPGARTQILEGEGHGSYIVHNRKIAHLIHGFVMETDSLEEGRV